MKHHFLTFATSICKSLIEPRRFWQVSGLKPNAVWTSEKRSFWALASSPADHSGHLSQQIKQPESRTLALTGRISLVVSHSPSSFPSRELIILRAENVRIQHEVLLEMCKYRGQDDCVVKSVRMFQGWARQGEDLSKGRKQVTHEPTGSCVSLLVKPIALPKMISY